jgi:hypothetical protein
MENADDKIYCDIIDCSVNSAIHCATGSELIEECQKLHGCKIGEIEVTRGNITLNNPK